MDGLSVICNWQSYSHVPVLSIGRVVEKAFVLVVSLGIFNRSFYLNCAGLCLFTRFFVIYKINKDRSPLPMLCVSAELTSSEGLFLQGAAPSGELGGVDFVSFTHIFHSFIKDQYFQIKDKWLWGYLCNSKQFFSFARCWEYFSPKKELLVRVVYKGRWWRTSLYAFWVPLLLFNSSLMEIIYAEQFEKKYM